MTARRCPSLALLVACCLCVDSAGAWPPERERALPLRLDEAPDLPLLASFRHPQGRPASFLAGYRAGPWGRWPRRLWTPLVGAGSSAVPVRDPGSDAWLARALEPDVRFPLVATGRHWFLLGAGTEPLRIDDWLVAPWLRRLDPQLAIALLAELGCGRGSACLRATFPAATFATLWEALAPRAFPIPEWKCRERPAALRRYGGEHDTFVLARCDGSLGVDALVRLSLLARPVGMVRPSALPAEPDPRAVGGEWVPGLRLVHPRLVWLVHRIHDAFRWRAIYLYSGYRPGADPGKLAGHQSMHRLGRALDLAVEGVAAEEVLAVCARLADVGCGYYPNGRFVHVDVRPRGHGEALWVDAARPGEPSRYLTDWPGVVRQGRLAWRRAGR